MSNNGTIGPNGRRTSITDANGNRASMTWDGHDRQIRWNFPSPTTPGQVSATDYEAYAYDLAGNRTSLRKRDGSTLTFQYDALNRMTLRVVPERAGLSSTHTRDVHYGYDIGNRQTFARFDSPSGEGVTNVYDSLGRQISSILAMSGTSRQLAYLYDGGGRRSRITHPDGTAFLYQYDAGGAPTFVTTPTDWLVNAWYNAAGLPTIISRANSTWTGRYFDGIARLTALELMPVGSAHNVHWYFGYNPAGQITQVTHTNDAYASTTAYDVTRPYTVNGLNQYTAAGPATFGYDANGNLTSDGSTNFLYDVENRLVTASGARTAALLYDPLGRLFQTSGGAAGVTQFLYDGDALIAEYDATGALQRRYAHWVGADVPVVEYIGAGTTDPRQLFPNHQGSIVAATGAGAAMLFRNTYDEWGIPGAANQGRFQYTGQAWIPELGMYHYKARVYSPTLGRFLQTDPVGYDDQINLYAYVANDPVNHTDPTGEFRCEFAPGACGMRPITPEERERTERAARSVGAAAGTVASFLPAGRALGWLWRALGWGGRALSQATRTAVSGGRHASLIRQFAERSTTSLNRTVSSLTRRIEDHQEKIRNPAEHMTRDDARDPQAVQRAINDWSREIRNYSEQRDIARDFLRNRPQCTGTRICP